MVGYLSSALSRKDSSLPACLFEKPSPTPATDYIVDYDTLFGVIVHEYVLASGGIEAGRILWPTIEGSLKNALLHLDPATFVLDPSRVKAWKFLDWAENLDMSAGMHGVLLYSLKVAVALAKRLGISPLPYIEIINRMTNSANVFLQLDTGLFISGPQKQVSPASAAWLALSTAFLADVSRRALLSALSHPQTIKPLTPYLYHYICDALASVGLY
jgi:alpha-L-rhamnosidase